MLFSSFIFILRFFYSPPFPLDDCLKKWKEPVQVFPFQLFSSTSMVTVIIVRTLINLWFFKRKFRGKKISLTPRRHGNNHFRTHDCCWCFYGCFVPLWWPNGTFSGRHMLQMHFHVLGLTPWICMFPCCRRAAVFLSVQPLPAMATGQCVNIFLPEIFAVAPFRGSFSDQSVLTIDVLIFDFIGHFDREGVIQTCPAFKCLPEVILALAWKHHYTPPGFISLFIHSSFAVSPVSENVSRVDTSVCQVWLHSAESVSVGNYCCDGNFEKVLHCLSSRLRACK